MIATLLYLGYPSNATRLKDHHRIDNERANYLTQLSLWQLVKGQLISFLPGRSYQYDLHYYACKPEGPYFGKYGDIGKVSFSGDTSLKKVEIYIRQV